MKKISKKIIFVSGCVILFSFFLVLYVKAISTEQFINATPEKTSLPDFLGGFYDFSILISGILAVGMIVFGGIYWIFASASPDKQNEGKNIIIGALWGLALLLGSYFILKTVNPTLTTLRDPGGNLAIVADYKSCYPPEQGTQNEGGVQVKEKLPFCDIGEYPRDPKTGKCKCYINTEWEANYMVVEDLVENGSESAGNEVPGGCPQESDIDKISGVYCSAGDCRLLKNVLPGLKKAEEIAQKKGVNIEIYSALRTIQRQTELFNAAVKKYGSESAARKWVAKPSCGAPHVRGVAVDARLKGKSMTSSNKQLLQEIFKEAGWKRYCAEWWHFQYLVEPKVSCSP